MVAFLGFKARLEFFLVWYRCKKRKKHCFIAQVDPTVIHQPPGRLLTPIRTLGVDINRFETTNLDHHHSVCVITRLSSIFSMQIQC